MKTYVNLQYHQQDDRIKIVEEDICQTLSSAMGMGGNNVPLVIEIDDNLTEQPKQCDMQ